MHTKKSGKVVILELRGRFDAQEVEPVAAWFNEQTGAGNAWLAVNLDGVNFIDSTGLSALVQGVRRCHAKGGNLHLYALQEQVARVFQLTRLDKAVSIFATEAEAVGALTPSGR